MKIKLKTFNEWSKIVLEHDININASSNLDSFYFQPQNAEQVHHFCKFITDELLLRGLSSQGNIETGKDRLKPHLNAERKIKILI